MNSGTSDYAILGIVGAICVAVLGGIALLAAFAPNALWISIPITALLAGLGASVAWFGSRKAPRQLL